MNTTLNSQLSAVPVSCNIESRPRFNSFKTVELFAYELQGFICNLGAALLLFVILLMNLSSLVAILSNGVIDGFDVVYWELSVAVTIVLFGYGLWIGTEGKSCRNQRVIVQWMFWTLPILCLHALGIWSVLFCLIKTATDAGLMVIGAAVGNLFANSSFVRFCRRLSSSLFRFEYSKGGICRWGLAIILTSVSGAALVFALLAGSVIGREYLTKHAEQVRWVGKPAPSLTLITADGDSWSLEEHRGKVLLLEYFEPTGGPSEAAMPYLREIYEEFAGHEDFVMASVSWGEKEDSKDWFEAHQAAWQLLGPGDEWEAGFRPKSILRAPTAYIIDRNGTVSTVLSAIYNIMDHPPAISAEKAASLEKSRCAAIKQELELLLSP